MNKPQFKLYADDEWSPWINLDSSGIAKTFNGYYYSNVKFNEWCTEEQIEMVLNKMSVKEEVV